MGGAKLLKWRLAAEGAKLLKSRAVLILTSPPWAERRRHRRAQIGERLGGRGGRRAVRRRGSGLRGWGGGARREGRAPEGHRGAEPSQKTLMRS